MRSRRNITQGRPSRNRQLTGATTAALEAVYRFCFDAAAGRGQAGRAASRAAIESLRVLHSSCTETLESAGVVCHLLAEYANAKAGHWDRANIIRDLCRAGFYAKLAADDVAARAAAGRENIVRVDGADYDLTRTR